MSLLPCPSHLESVNPVALGKVRAKYLCQSGGPYQSSGERPHETPYQDSKVLPSITTDFMIVWLHCLLSYLLMWSGDSFIR